MNKIQVLDCTLRDGGYCNQWEFGFSNIRRVISEIVHAGIDIVECGFLTDIEEYCKDKSRFTSITQLEEIIPYDRSEKMFVVMVNDNEYDLEKLPTNNGKTIDGIRLAFHKENLSRALRQCKLIKNKGYKLFVQPMVSLNYSDEEFIELIKKVNEIEPYAFYIVDSFGMMKQKDLMRLFYIVENNLNEQIWIGFHAHNNLQLAYSNAQAIINMPSNRNLIIDSSVYGMGRGAGNLNTELFVDFLNESIGSGYKLTPLLDIIDEILNDFYQRDSWGYTLPNYLSAVHNAHPKYASYLDDKKTLTVKDMNEIFNMMDVQKKNSYDKEYIEKLYYQFMKKDTVLEKNRSSFINKLVDKKVLLIAPGKSSVEQMDKIIEFANLNDVIVISINFKYKYIDNALVFLSNLRRFRELEKEDLEKCIITSNIVSEEAYFRTDYDELLNDEEGVQDNAGLMAIRFLILCGVKDIYLAGFDGYTHDYQENYGDSQRAIVTNSVVLDQMNKGIKKVMMKYSDMANLIYITEPKLRKM